MCIAFALDASVNQFVKLYSATPTQVLSLIIAPERAALQAQLAGLEQEEESEECFIQAAQHDLKVTSAVLVVIMYICLPLCLYRLEKMNLPKRKFFEMKWTELLLVHIAPFVHLFQCTVMKRVE